ncbi:hypothetical protein LCGC14_0143010 [marine sediment metagenome]|uniref:Uncharacterized protein n=1 Tax=marine sediment metagenome TaxID=412755 RepID=A0A0F9V1C2_9ZZZZ
MKFHEPMAKLMIALLNDDDGIREEAYDVLVDVVIEQGGRTPEIEEILKHVDACDGRFFLPERFEQIVLKKGK